MSRYTCAVCPAPIGSAFLMCPSHWRLVPKPLALEVLNAWQQLTRSSPPATRMGRMDRYALARQRAIAAVQVAQVNAALTADTATPSTTTNPT